MRAAPKTVIKLLGWTNRKAGRFFIMKWAQAHQICAAFFELHKFANHINNVDACQQILDKGLWYH